MTDPKITIIDADRPNTAIDLPDDVIELLASLLLDLADGEQEDEQGGNAA